jgi:glycine cleavage system H lipoate-binding protein
MVRPLLAPISGAVSEVNPSVMAEPRLVNGDPYGRAWLVRIAAGDWESERRHFIQGSDAVTAWVQSELAAHART